MLTGRHYQDMGRGGKGTREAPAVFREVSRCWDERAWPLGPWWRQCWEAFVFDSFELISCQGDDRKGMGGYGLWAVGQARASCSTLQECSKYILSTWVAHMGLEEKP